MSIQDDSNIFLQRLPLSNIVATTQQMLTGILTEAATLKRVSEISADITFLKNYCAGNDIATLSDPEVLMLTYHMWNILTVAGFSPWVPEFSQMIYVQGCLGAYVGTEDSWRAEAVPILAKITGKLQYLTPTMQASMKPLIAYFQNASDNKIQISLVDKSQYNAIMALVNGPPT
jgi:hypothetical protein